MNIHSDPESFGLTIVKDHDAAGAYEFRTVLLLRDIDGPQHYALYDSGCSCPIPFERKGRDDLTPINSRADLDRFAREAWEFEGDVERHVAELLDLPAGVRL